MEKFDRNNELSALISLLDEPSDQIFDQIRDKLLVYGTQAIPSLEHAWDNSFDSQIQVRIEEIIHSIQLMDLHNELYAWKKEQRYDLFKGFFLVARYQYPELSETFISERIEIIKRDIWLELNSNLTALEKVKVINHIIFDIHGFSGNKVNIDAPQNLFINNVLESRKGNHLSMGILYIIIAQKLGIPVFGVNLPQHFILAYVDEIHEEKYTLANENEVLFYINPFNKGAVFTRREIEIFIKHLKMEKETGYFKPCDNVVIIHRVLENLRNAFNKQGYGEKVDEVKSLIQVLQKP
ncbi:MAG: transglutaminase-like domain-containing protein [Bacteroidetes bacterium]|nr:transglutaminase-like domain-containing protein [Bacteroidota bacterium]